MDEPWRRWLALFAAARLASAISGLSVSYWAASHLGRAEGSQFIGWTSAGSGLLEALLALLAASRISEVGIQGVLKWLGVSAASSALWAAIAPTPLSLLALRGMDGLIAGFVSFWTLQMILVSTRESSAGRKLPSWFESVFLLSFALGSVLAPILWRQSSTFALVAPAVIYLVIAFSKVGVRHSTGSQKPSFQFTTAIPLASLAMSASASMWVTQVTFLLTSLKYPGQRFPGAFSPTSTGLVVVAYLGVAMIGFVVWSHLMGRWTPEKVVRTSFLGALAAPFALMLSNMTVFSERASSAILLVYTFCVVVQVGLVPGGMALAASKESGRLGSLSFQFVAASSIGAIVGSLLGGVIASRWSITGLCLSSLSLALFAGLSVRSALERSNAHSAGHH